MLSPPVDAVTGVDSIDVATAYRLPAVPSCTDSLVTHVAVPHTWSHDSNTAPKYHAGGGGGGNWQLLVSDAFDPQQHTRCVRLLEDVHVNAVPDPLR